MRKKTRESYRREIKKAYDKLNKAYRELRDSNIQIIFRVAVMAEYRDLTTGTHLVRIADYSAIIAEGMGLPRSEVELIRYSSPMHDIGKLMLPDSILKKKGKLSGKEWELMRRHPLVGSEIFRNSTSPLMKSCGVIALTHHERHDGSGYPAGLKGNGIPLYGRIVGIADVFDALTSNRPYKKAYGFNRSVSMITDMAGSHFDPEIVAAFIRSKDRLKGVWQANRDIEDFIRDIGVSAKDVSQLDLRVSFSFPVWKGMEAAKIKN